MKQLLHGFCANSIWRHRDVRLVLPARALSSFGDDMTLIVLILRVYDLGVGPWSITALLFCAAFPVVVLARVAGRLVDSVPFRKLALITALWQASCCVALSLGGPLWTTLALVLLLQAGHVVAGPTWQALIPNIAGRDEVGRVVSTSQAMNTVAMVAAPAVAGLTVAAVGYAAPLLIDGATFLALGAAALAVHARRKVGVEPGAADGAETATPFSLRADALLWPLIVGLCVFVLAGEVTNVVEVFLVRGTLGASSATFGLVGAVLAAGLVVGSVAAGRNASDPARAMRAALAAGGLALALVTAGLAPTLSVFAVAWLVLGVMNGLLNVDVTTLLLSRTPEPARGRALATVNAMARASTLGAMALGGAAGTLLGPRGSFVAAGAVSTVVAVALVLRVRRFFRESPATLGEEPASRAKRLGFRIGTRVRTAPPTNERRSSMATITEPRELLINDMKAMLYVEQRLAEDVLPELSGQISNSEFKAGVEEHLEETRRHVENLERAFELLGEEPKPDKSHAIDGLVAQHDKVVKNIESDEVRDIFNAGAAAKTEHLEIAAYEGMITTADALGEDEIKKLLEENMDEEESALKTVQSVCKDMTQETAAV